MHKPVVKAPTEAEKFGKTPTKVSDRFNSIRYLPCIDLGPFYVNLGTIPIVDLGTDAFKYR